MAKKKSNISKLSRDVRRKKGVRKIIHKQRQERCERHQRLETLRLRRNQNSRCQGELKMAFSYQPEMNYSRFSHIGDMCKVCVHCGAKKWKDEAPGLCCSGGKVKLQAYREPPEPLKSLIFGAHPSSQHFLNNSRKYNTLFQMTSFGANEVREGNFMPTFKVYGQVYHRIGSLLPLPGNDAQFLQIYFLPEDNQLSTRSNIMPNAALDRNLISILQNLLHTHNVYIQSFKNNLEISSAQENLQLLIHADRVPANAHRRRYNVPTTNEVAVLLANENKGPRDIILRTRDEGLQRISELHCAYDALQYPLMFPRGEDGYYLTIPLKNIGGNKTVTCMQYYAYRLMVRENCLNHLHYFKNLFNQYCVDMMAKMISERLSYIRHHQAQLRVDDYIHLRDALNDDADVNASDVGQRVILPSTFTGSPRYMHEKAQDALTYVCFYGHPDLFITFTCNPDWPEIKNELFTNQTPHDRHDIIARVFNLKMKKLLHLLTKTEIFGPVQCYACSVEWQKRGLPHCHLLLWMQKRIQPCDIDKIISAEIPDRVLDPELYQIVTKFMIHGPCGSLNNQSPCMENGKCTKHYPREFALHTQTGDDGYPTYQRRSPTENGHTAIINMRGVLTEIDNRWVVPYCPVLSRIFNAHINVEYCHSVKAIKYICKYITKGPDQAVFSVQNNSDEVEKYENGRYISTSEAMWRFFDFPIHERFPTVVHLAVHLENGQRVYFNQNNLQQIVQNPRRTTLTAFFDLCRTDNFARTLLYNEVPSYYTWSNNQWSRRKRGQDVEGHPGIKKDSAIGRVYTVHPCQTECFYLRLLLHNVRGPGSFQELRTVNGIVFSTFQAACMERGLLESDDHWKQTLEDAALTRSPAKLKKLFAIILVFCQPSDPGALWEKFKCEFCEDILYRERCRKSDMTLQYSENIFNLGLIEIEDEVVALSEKHLADFGLPSPMRIRREDDEDLLITLNQNYDLNELQMYVSSNESKLINDQQYAYDLIVDSVINNKGKIFFIDAPGGTGKTFLINLLLAKIRSLGKTAIAVASSGIAATLLSGGKTAHSTFKLPLNILFRERVSCAIRKNGPLGKFMQKVDFAVWDECTMSHKIHVEAVDSMFQDFKSTNRPMGGTTFVFSGDFRQTLPVIARGTRADVVNACLKTSYLWHVIEKIHLRTNMRIHFGGGNNEFNSQLLKIGDGSINDVNDSIVIDKRVGQIVTSIHDLIEKVYPDIENILNKPHNWLRERAIVSPLNKCAQEINDIILGKLQGETKVYKSINTVIDADDAVHFPQEFLESLDPQGFPPHLLKLKIGAVVILLRNLNPPSLCNGTRLVISDMRPNIIEAVILTGPAAGETTLIPRIPMIPTELPFQFKRLQFPLKLSFVITINKSQGQTFNCVGVDLRSNCFSHGQLYVGLSRTGNPSNQFILLPENNTTQNVIYPEVLSHN